MPRSNGEQVEELSFPSNSAICAPYLRAQAPIGYSLFASLVPSVHQHPAVYLDSLAGDIARRRRG